MCQAARFGAVFMLGLAAMCGARAETPEATTTLTPPVSATTAATTDAAASATRKPPPDFSADVAARKNYVFPALAIVGFDVLLNQYNRRYISDEYKSNMSSIRRNLRRSWAVDNDPFGVNQLGHPYQGSIYHRFARTSGLSYWESLAYTFAGSAFWEIAGETTPPSRNDQIASGIGGTFLGEALFRLSSLMLEHGGSSPPLWREIVSTAITPSMGINRFIFHNREIFPGHDPAYYSRIQVGFSGTAKNDQGTSTTKLRRNEALTDFSIDYGLPGKPGYTYARPFDYFNLQATASSANGFESLFTRGLLVGKDYEAGEKYRGIWGLYGSYDYMAPQIFRVSSSALSVGTTAQWRLSDSFAVQGTGLLGVGYAAVGTTRGDATDREYHYGVAPQALFAMRLIYADSASLDLTAREYFVSNVGAADRGGHDNIFRVDASFTQRISRRHAITIKYLGNRRDATYPDLGSRTQSRGTIGIFYTFMGQDGFGKVDWR